MSTLYRFVAFEGDAGFNVLFPSDLTPAQAAAAISDALTGTAGAYDAAACAGRATGGAAHQIASGSWRNVAPESVSSVYVIRGRRAINAHLGPVVTAYAVKPADMRGNGQRTWLAAGFWRGRETTLSELAQAEAPNMDALIAELLAPPVPMPDAQLN